MSIKRWITTILGCTLLLVISGCDLIIDPKALMRTPQLSSDRENLKSVINAEGGSILRSRDTNDVKSIKYIDLDNDGVMEAVVFYETPDELVRIHGMVLSYENSEWVKKATFDGEGQVLEFFDLKSVTDDGNINIIAGFSNGDKELQNGLIVYKYQGGNVEKLIELPYNYVVLEDMNNDDKLDITVIYKERTQDWSITTKQYEDGEFKVLDKIEGLDLNVNDYYNVVHGKVTPDMNGIIMDASIGTHTAFSHLIVMDEGKLVDVLPQTATFKEYPVKSGDINSDGILEIGLLERPYGWTYIDFDEIPWFFSYYQWSKDKGLKFVMQQYMDLNGRFYFNFPPEWHGLVSIDTKSDKNEYLRFYRIKEDETTDETMAEIKFFSLSEWDQAEAHWELLVRINDRVIGFRSSSDLKVNKNEKEIKR